MNNLNTLDNNYQFNDPYIRIPKKPDDYTVVIPQNVPTDMITFHSPDTMFTSPFLSMTEIKLYGYLQGVSSQQFIEPDLHPKFKLLSNAAVLISVLAPRSNKTSFPSAPVINSLTANPTTVSLGEVITISWSFSGQDLASAKLTRINPDGSTTPLNGGSDVSTPGSYDDLATTEGTVTYKLVVSSEFAGPTSQTVTVQVNP